MKKCNSILLMVIGSLFSFCLQAEEHIPPKKPRFTIREEVNGCNREVSKVCPDGYSDSCGLKDAGGKSVFFDHFCTKDTAVGASCRQENARECADGERDACLFKPARASTHQCVLVDEN